MGLFGCGGVGSVCGWVCDGFALGTIFFLAIDFLASHKPLARETISRGSDAIGHWRSGLVIVMGESQNMDFMMLAQTVSTCSRRNIFMVEQTMSPDDSNSQIPWLKDIPEEKSSD